MANLDYCFSNLPLFQKIECAQWLKGGIDGIILFEADASIASYTVLANWTTLISNGDAAKIENIKGELPTPSPVEEDNAIGCGNDTVVTGFDFDLHIMDSNVNAGNDAKYASINGQTYYMAIHLCNDNQLLIIESPVTVIAPQANVPLSKKERQMYDTHYKWSADKDFYYIRITSPSGLF